MSKLNYKQAKQEVIKVLKEQGEKGTITLNEIEHHERTIHAFERGEVNERERILDLLDNHFKHYLSLGEITWKAFRRNINAETEKEAKVLR